MDKVALVDILVWILRLSPVSTIPLMPNTHLLHVALTRRTKGRKQPPIQKSNALAHVGGPLGIEKLFHTDFLSFKKTNRFLGFS